MTVIYAVRTTVGREEGVLEKLDLVLAKQTMTNKTYGIKAVLLPKELKGYVLVEADSVGDIEEALSGINHVRGIVRHLVRIDEIKHFLETRPANVEIEKGDLVEVVSGAFKGEKAKTTRVDVGKREVTIEFVEAAVAIPVTVPLEAVRVIQHLNTGAGLVDKKEENTED
ncbi:MAG: transcription elongation factor Spt5 [archaeon]